MPIGANIPTADKLIKRTTTVSSAENEKTGEETAKKAHGHRFLSGRENATTNTVKMTFYVKQELLDKLYNYAYWDRMTVTEAFNKTLGDGLKDKNTSNVKK